MLLESEKKTLLNNDGAQFVFSRSVGPLASFVVVECKLFGASTSVCGS